MNTNPSHFHCICVTDLEQQLGALRREYDEEAFSHDLAEKDLKQKVATLERRLRRAHVLLKAIGEGGDHPYDLWVDDFFKEGL